MTGTYDVQSLDDPRIALYRNLTDGDLTERGDWFIAEGSLVVERLLASDFEVHSVLCIEAKAADLRRRAQPNVPVYVASRSLMREIVGFKFHMGVMAVGRQRLYSDLDRVLERILSPAASPNDSPPATIVVLPHLRNAQNLGSIARSAAAFGAAAMVLGPGGTNPYWRYAVRVSMGAMFALPIVRSLDLARDMKRLREPWGFERFAAVLDDEAEPLSGITPDRHSPRTAIVLGSEDEGLDETILGLCDRKVTIPMAGGIDSLNVAMSAAVMLYEFGRR